VTNKLIKLIEHIPERFEGAQQPEDAEDAEDARTRWRGEWNDEVHQRNDDQSPVDDVPTTAQIGVLRECHAFSDHLPQNTAHDTDSNKLVLWLSLQDNADEHLIIYKGGVILIERYAAKSEAR